jgi:hypothetical protein
VPVAARGSARQSSGCEYRIDDVKAAARTTRMLSLTVPPTLLATAVEAIE